MTHVLTLVGALGLVAVLTVVGWPVVVLCTRGSTANVVPAPVAGLAVLSLFAWYWSDLGGPLSVGVPVLVALAVVAAAVVAWRTGRRPSFGRANLPLLAELAVVTVVTAVLCAVNFAAPLRLDYLTTTAFANNDAAAWVQSGEHLEELSLDDPGNVADYDFGASSKTNGFGGIVLLGAAAGLSGYDVWKVGMIGLFAAVGLVVLCTGRLVRHVTGLPPWLCGAVAGAAVSPLLFWYSVGNYFLGQMMAMAVVPCLALAARAAAEPGRRRDRVGLTVLVALCLFLLLSTYPHMAVLAIPLVGPAALVGPRQGIVGRFLRIAELSAVALAAAMLVAPTLTRLSLERAIDLGSTSAGWSLPAFLPTELLGFGRTVNPQVSAARIVGSIVIVAVVVILAVRVRSSRPVASAYALALAGTVLGTYALVYLTEGGPTYQQWKWISYLQPIFAAVALGMVAVWIVRQLDRRRRAAGPVAAVVVLALVGTVATVNGSDALSAGMRGSTNLVADLALAGLHESPALDDLDEVNVRLSPFWETMWASYFLRPRTAYLLQPSYYAITPATAAWTLERISYGPLPAGQGERTINEMYRLVEEPQPPFSAGGAALDATLEVVDEQVAAGVRTVRLRATNTGIGTWLPSTEVTGGVKLSGALLDDTGAVVVQDLLRSVMLPDRPVDDGWTVEFVVEVPDTSIVQLQMVAENVERFGAVVVVGGNG